MMTLEVFTGRICDWRHWQGTDVLPYDITLKSGDLTFAPTPELLWPHKQGIIDSREYTSVFKRITRERYRKNPEPWQWLIRQHRIALLCYCGHGKFCHRHLVKEQLYRLCLKERIQFINGGEPVW